MKKKKALLSFMVFAVLLASTVMLQRVAFAVQGTDLDSPFGFTPAAVIPPFLYGIENPYGFAVELGVTWDRSINFVWTLNQPDVNREQYSWMNERQVLDVPHQMRIVANIMIGNPLFDVKYGQYAVGSRSFLPRDKDAYARYVQALVERYDGDGIADMPGLRVPIKYWQVDNEPPHGLSGYAAFLRLTYKAIKAADPDAKVLIGGVPGFPPVSQYLDDFNKNYLPILDELSKYTEPCFDIFDLHWYGNATGDYLGIKKAFSHIQEALRERKLMPAEGFWVTEMSTYSGDPRPVAPLGMVDFPYQTERQQAVDLVRRNVLPLSLGIQKIFMAFGITEGFKHDGGYFDFTGLIYDGRYGHDQGKGVKKLSYYAYKKMTEILDGADWKSIKTVQETGDIYIYQFNRKGKSIWVAWNDSKTPQQVTLQLEKNVKGATITEAVPHYALGRDVISSDTAFKKIRGKISKTSPPRLTFELNESPVFVEAL